MRQFKANIWTLFYLIAFSGFGLLIWLSINTFQHEKKELHDHLLVDAKFLSQMAHASLAEKELSLDVLGSRLFEDQTYQDKTESQKILDKALELTPSLTGFGVFSPDGKILASTSNMEHNIIPNLKTHAATRDSFTRTLQSHNMVIGKTYFFKPLNEWIIPIRKAVRNHQGKVIGVITAGLKIGKNGFINQEHALKNRNILIVNDVTKNRILLTGMSQKAYTTLYRDAIPTQTIEQVEQFFKEEYNLSIEDVKQHKETTFLEFYSINTGQEVAAATLFDPLYQVWFVLFQDKQKLHDEVFHTITIYFLVFMIILVLIYQLFSVIYRNERETKQKLIHQLTHDPLTGLPNREYIDIELKDELANPQNRYDLLFLDLDNFKDINDNFGHEIGDKVLIEVANRFKTVLGEQGWLIRFGGDEFVFIKLPVKTELSLFAEQIIKVLSDPFIIEDMNFNIGASIGMASYPNDSDDLKTLLSFADLAMYEAKKQKNTFAHFSSHLREDALQKVLIEHLLKQAIIDNEISIVYQPQLNVKEELIGAEALVRWHNETLGEVPPSTFIPIAEEMGFMPELGRHIADLTLSEIGPLQSKLRQSFEVSMNISVRQFMSIGFYEDITRMINESTLKPELIMLEVTESIFMEELDFVIDILEKLKSHGIMLSMDDFGTGFSSLSLLRTLPIHELKIDKSFIDDILHEEKNYGLVENIIEIAQKLKMQTVAEGIESEAQAKLLTQFGCDIFQGYYFSKPLTYSQLEDYLQTTPIGKL
ncbi:Phytochrome-like protein cph2 [Hydrogenovibrio crunogenus]|uniref:Phytochrome-like protein cph2 n=1 Tax=Hydrogenovibrio crunogenus TaxID=39765 RepID=A0A4P7NZ52_9GAMM|nr:EAL domain-containing protein [Hydrogenovibrio crunogenus]QBZ83101.1 Phytochrome-like protein cph2 [Hydrogenovibrio crunogenus]